MKNKKQKFVSIDLEVIDKLKKRDPKLSPNNHLRRFLKMEPNLQRGPHSPKYKKQIRKAGEDSSGQPPVAEV